MDEVGRQNDRRNIQKPPPYFAAEVDDQGENHDENNPRPDFHIRAYRDIDENGVFLNQRVFQPSNLNNNLVNIFNLDFDEAQTNPLSRFGIKGFKDASLMDYSDMRDGTMKPRFQKQEKSIHEILMEDPKLQQIED